MSIEAMKLWLKALETSWYHVGTFCPTDAAIELYDEARNSLRQAIEQAQKQEPVAWRNAALRVGEDLCSVGPFGYYDMTAEQWLEWALSVVTVHAPPTQRQPLTDEQILDAHVIAKASFKRSQQGVRGQMLTSQDLFDWHLARAIEAAHGIKE